MYLDSLVINADYQSSYLPTQSVELILSEFQFVYTYPCPELLAGKHADVLSAIRERKPLLALLLGVLERHRHCAFRQIPASLPVIALAGCE